MVRLRLRNALASIASFWVSIPLWCDCDFCHLPSVGLHLSVSIPLWCDCDRCALCGKEFAPSSFNPTMVRLRPLRPNRKLSCTSTFQSHYGAIATRVACQSCIALSLVSIPLWCDCDCPISKPRRLPSLVSIPLWCDCDVRGYLRGRRPLSFQSHYGAIATYRLCR